AAADGWTNRVDSPVPVEKLFQLMIARSVVCLTISDFPAGPIDAPPLTTVPPCGLANPAPVEIPANAAASAKTRRPPPRRATLITYTPPFRITASLGRDPRADALWARPLCGNRGRNSSGDW